MKVHTQHLATKRQHLQAHCAWERQQVARLGGEIENRLAGIDRVIAVVKNIVGRPFIFVAAAGGLLLIGRWRLLRLFTKGFMWFAVAQRMRNLFAR